MSHHSSSSGSENTAKTMLWGCELSQEKQTCTFRPQGEKKDRCRLSLSAICLGEKAKEEVNRVEILPSSNQEDRKSPVTIASLRASVLPMVTLTGVELRPPVTFRLRTGSGPVFLCGHECYETSDISWEDDEEEEVEEEEEEEDEDEDVDVSLEETPIKQVKRTAPQKQMSLAKKKKLEKEEEQAVRPSPQDKSPWKKVKATPKPKKSTSKK
ncbi:nucleoplasmin-2 [Phodopus roborovskii]|uniref:Nucleoplasmin-2 n=1 Tax=Phodopus roborovskii TaxID=109678 RepID=A0AAU9ZR35_PHORO|nr:nucleoplasmin-2 [Phodopus roborovskii]CAH6825409.1 Npm2 [Phodopus roborovskii]